MTSISIFQNATIASVMGAVFGGVIATWISRKEISRVRDLQKIDKFLATAEDLNCEASFYWHSRGQDEKLERKIKILNERLYVDLESLKAHICSDIYRKIHSVVSEIFDLTTGDGFESVNRSANSVRVKRIKNRFERINEVLSNN